MVGLLWLIPALPFLAFLIIVFLFPRPSRTAGYVSILAILASFILSLLTLLEAIGGSGGDHGVWHVESVLPWLNIGRVQVGLGTFVDPIGAIMLVVVTAVSALVQIYSQGYMSNELHPAPDGSNAGYSRFYAYLSLFTMSMLGLVLAPNFLQMFIFWELVGLCSYLLVGFWYRKPEAASAAKKAFLTTRVGDLGFLIGILMLFAFTGSFAFGEIEAAIGAGVLAGTPLTVALVLLFMGAVGKSAQFPLHVWLPDAMEGPTPVSALIHAATMVAAGVFMVARAFGIFSAAPDAMMVIAYIGGFTALFAATHGIVARDIKRVLAYSTVSQLGYMMMALGVGALGAGFFHLTTHAFFKALLFLGAGSVIHGSGEQDLYRMGGLFGKMRTTGLTFLIGAVALAGIFPFAGFWSKDEILYETLHSGHTLLYVMGIVTAFLTAFYIFRAFFLAFTGERRLAGAHVDARTSDVHEAGMPADPHGHVAHGHTAVGPLGAHDTHGHAAHDAHESPGVMTLPLVLLAIPAALIGLLGSPFTNNWFGSFVTGHEAHAVLDPFVAGLSTILALAGIGLAWLLYWRRAEISERTEPLRALGPLYPLFVNRYYLDDLYDWFVGKVVLGVSELCYWIDKYVVDGVVNGVAATVSNVGNVVNRSETGRVTNYLLVVFTGIAVMAAVLYISPAMR